MRKSAEQDWMAWEAEVGDRGSIPRAEAASQIIERGKQSNATDSNCHDVSITAWKRT